ncbi:MAG TPA: LON peptidase substrate-binding domain-containing protein [Nevskia sp.]|jgi:Lon protease-like protein|nr:LON peptidase substrate-binding domain-containing protein [Nevskia sp.]
MAATLEIPIFPLGTVLYPAGRLPLRIFEPRYVEMTRACLRDNSVFGVALIQAGYEVGKPAVPCTTGCTARIVEWSDPVPGQFILEARGETVFRILERWTTNSGLIMARVALEEPADPLPLPQRHAALGKLLLRLMEEIGEDNFPRPQRMDDAAWVANRLCELLPVEPERKQKLLEALDPLAVLGGVEQVLKELREDH